jgi:hypothetical protein
MGEIKKFKTILMVKLYYGNSLWHEEKGFILN